ncbi:MAG: AI-2E family transporter [Prevotella sp.]|uniref:AI-2E family transporter n=1 Tax=Prevotella sp. TaxID=59823 RepID=UPI002A32618F|nr:AI-2E family transporter [Prevotella sp.]MDD7319000.1 AI-2E family transporter [Prevotellaceae bacterium]MDY4020780.1 AI-2E family transporter [Prevotella sp.]
MEQKITFDKLIRWVITALVVAAVIFAIDYLSSVLLPFFVAWLLAYLLYPIVHFTQYRLHVPTRALSIVVSLIFVTAVLGVVFWLIFPPMIEQFEKLGMLITQYVQDHTNSDNISHTIQQWVSEHYRQIEDLLKQKDVTDAIKGAMPKVFNMLGQTANVIISIIASLITLLYMFFILLDYEYLTHNWIKIFPKKNRPFWAGLAGDVKRELNNYIRGQGLVALVMGILFCIGFTIIDFPMAIGLGILIGIMDLVPYLHTFALIPTAFLALLKAVDTGQNFWIILASAVAVFCIVQVIIDLIVTPKIMGKAMRLNPAILLLSLSIWGALLGFIGLIIALPLTTIIIAYYQRYVTKDEDTMEEMVAESTAADEKNQKDSK